MVLLFIMVFIVVITVEVLWFAWWLSGLWLDSLDKEMRGMQYEIQSHVYGLHR